MTVVRGNDLHGVAPVAMQQGRHVARSIRSGTRTPFHYNDKGELATIGRARAVGLVKGVRVPGFLAWACGSASTSSTSSACRTADRAHALGVRLSDARARRA